MPGLDRRLAQIEARLSPRPVPPAHDVCVVTIDRARAMSPVERATAYREMILGRAELETGRDRAPVVDIGDPWSMSPEQRAGLYQALVRGEHARP